MSKPVDVLIVGAGVNGLLSALHLAREGMSVTVLDRGGVARESTWAGAGILSALLPWDYGEVVNALVERGRALWPEAAAQVAEESGVDPEFLPCGMLALGDFSRDKALDWCRAHGWACTPVTAGEMPAVSFPEAATALWLPGVAQARNPRVGQALHGACLKAGVNILTRQEALSLEVGAGGIQALATATDRFTADRYVITAGAWTRTLLGPLGLGLDIRPIRGQILLFRAAPGLLPHIVYSQGKYLVPRRDGHILAGSTLEDAGFEKHNTPEGHQELVAFALATCPGLKDAELVYEWAGLRPGAPGNIPTIARHPDMDNLYVNSGHFRYGVTMAPASAEMLTQLVLHRPTTLDARPYAWPKP
ncbi:MAG: FAD-dependent oxidoreductase [Pseudomonadota bacterium]